MNKKNNTIKQIVRLREAMKKWRMGSTSSNNLYASLCTSPTGSPPPSDVPEGYLAVYVGREERRRYIIPMEYLTTPEFRTLLDKAEEEFGFDHVGGLTIPCDATGFEKVLKVLERKKH